MTVRVDGRRNSTREAREETQRATVNLSHKMRLFSFFGSVTALLLWLPPPLPNNQDSFKAVQRARCGEDEETSVLRGERTRRSFSRLRSIPSFSRYTALPLVLAGAHWLPVGSSSEGQSATGPSRTVLSVVQVMAWLTSCKWNGFSGPGLTC